MEIVSAKTLMQQALFPVLDVPTGELPWKPPYAPASLALPEIPQKAMAPCIRLQPARMPP
jgi:hypothetical protein